MTNYIFTIRTGRKTSKVFIRAESLEVARDMFDAKRPDRAMIMQITQY